MRRAIVLCFLCCCLPAAIRAQTIFIKDKTTGVAIANAEVSNPDRSKQVYSTFDGKADLSIFADSDTLYISAAGYPETVLSKREAVLRKEIFMSDEIKTFDEFVLSNAKAPRKRSEESMKITTITPAQVALINPQTAADLLAVSGEVFVQKSQLGGGSPMIRGFATNRVMIVVDGVRMNNAIFRSGNIQNVISIDPFAVASTEVLFGPGSNIYGSDAIGGVMNFQTLSTRYAKGDKPYFHGNVASRYASANYEKTAHLDFTLGWKKFSLVSSATYADFDDLRMGSYGPDEYLRKNYVKRINGRDSVLSNPNPQIQLPSGYSQINVMQKAGYLFKPGTELIYAFHFSETSEYSRYDRLIRPRGNTLRSAEWSYGPQRWMMHNLQFRRSSSGRFYNRMILNAAWQEFGESRIDRDLNKTERFTTEEQVKAGSVNIDLIKFFGRHKLTYGLEYVHNKVGSKGKVEDIITMTESAAQSRYPDGSVWTSAGAYMSYNHKLSEKTDLQAGMRYNAFRVDADFDSAVYKFPFTEARIRNASVTGNLGLTFKPDKRWFAALNASTGFRSPNVDDIGKVFESTPGSVVIPNPDLKSEYAYNVEATISRSAGEVFQADATVFYTWLDRALVRRPYLLNGQDSLIYQGTMSRVEAVQNAAFAQVYGLQAGFRLNLPEGFSISSRITWTKGKEELDNGETAPLRHAAPLFGVTRLMYTVKKLKCDLYALYNAEVSNRNLAPEEQAKDYLYAVDENGKPFSPKWLTLNFKLSYQLNSYLSLSTGIENITDLRYRPYSSGIVAPGRNFILALRAAF